MSRFRPNYERGNTVISTYSSIHSADAYVGDYQVMYTPGSSPRAQQKKPSGRFRTRHRDGTASIVIPANIPNTSQILPDRGTLPDVHFHYSVPPDEKEIVMSLRAVQRQLNAAMETIDQLERERDQAIHDLNVMRATSRKPATPAQKKEQAARVEEELFDISRLEDSPQKSPARSTSNKRASLGHKSTAKTITENDARIISSAAAKELPVMAREHDNRAGAKNSQSTRDRRSSRRATVQDTEESMLQDPTAASNISRRRRGHSLDENMTSAYIIPDITLAMKQQKEQQQAFKPSISKQAQGVLHDHDPQHIEGCEVCQRLTSKKHVQIKASANSHAHSGLAVNAGNDYTAQITALMKDIALEEPTFRPKIAPEQALAHLKKLLADQYSDAKRKHGEAWEEYDDIDAPKSSKRHAVVGEAMGYWARKMEECRVNLDQLRDVEEGMRRAEIV